MAKSAQSKAVAKVSGKKLAVANEDDMLAQLAEQSNAGFENVKAGDYAIPFLVVLQSGSPQTKKKDPAYVEGAVEGSLFNTMTKEVVDGEEGLLVIPCYFTKLFLEWKPREKGGGLAGMYSDDDPIQNTAVRNDKGANVLPNGNNLNLTCQHFVLLVNEDGETTQAIIAMSSTQLKKSKAWLSLMANQKLEYKGKTFRAPMFTQKYRLKTIGESNEKGSWAGWDISHEEMASAEEIAKGKGFYEAMERAGSFNASRKANYEGLDKTSGGGDSKVSPSADEGEDDPI